MAGHEGVWSASMITGFGGGRLRDDPNFCIWIDIEIRWPIPLPRTGGIVGSMGR